MHEPIQLRVGHHNAYLVLSDENATRSPTNELWSLSAALTLPNLQARGDVWLSGSEVPLGEFFDSLAADWRGWEAERRWEAYEGGLTLDVQNDARGHASISVELWEHSQHGWVVRGEVPLDPGQLEDVARGAHRLFGT
jgi:uncharacterized protein DUF6228